MHDLETISAIIIAIASIIAGICFHFIKTRKK